MRWLPLPAALLLAACADAEPRRYVLTAEDQLAIEYPLRVDIDDGRFFPAAVVARGDSIFHGQLRRGTCFTCHGDDARGGPVARDLTDNGWAFTDGSFEGVRSVVDRGVREHLPPMPARGDAPLGDDDVTAVSAYVYWLANRHGSPLRREAPRTPIAAGDTAAAPT
jgi:mono/diheme cytochrome c family protein